MKGKILICLIAFPLSLTYLHSTRLRQRFRAVLLSDCFTVALVSTQRRRLTAFFGGVSFRLKHHPVIFFFVCGIIWGPQRGIQDITYLLPSIWFPKKTGWLSFTFKLRCYVTVAWWPIVRWGWTDADVWPAKVTSRLFVPFTCRAMRFEHWVCYSLS